MNRRGLLMGTEGVLCETASLHKMSWERVMSNNSIDPACLTRLDFSSLSREQAMSSIMVLSGLELSASECKILTDEENMYYRQLLADLGPDSVLPGVRSLLHKLRHNEFRLCVVTSSKNAMLILRKLNLTDEIDAICDGYDWSSCAFRDGLYHHACSLIDTPPECVTVWDNIAVKRQAARQEGFPVISGNTAQVEAILLSGSLDFS